MFLTASLVGNKFLALSLTQRALHIALRTDSRPANSHRNHLADTKTLDDRPACQNSSTRQDSIKKKAPDTKNL